MNTKKFTEILLNWWSENKRDLPWKKDRDPYKIWLSEIILQQTRVSQGTPYFHKFLMEYPDIDSLANAASDHVMKSWQGLGYYSRARNLHHTAIEIVSKHNSVFPSTYEKIISLKGIGPYTAAAIASFAFELPHAVVDGNVIRLITRINGITDPADTASVKKRIDHFVNDAIKYASSSEFNQAIMDFGATVCLPGLPVCIHCPFFSNCLSGQNDTAGEIPVKSKIINRKTRFFHYYDISDRLDRTILQQRISKDIWHKLYQFPVLETETEMSPDLEEVMTFYSEVTTIHCSEDFNIQKIVRLKQTLTHRTIIGTFYKIKSNLLPEEINKHFCLVDRQKVSNFAFPKIMVSYFSDFDKIK